MKETSRPGCSNVKVYGGNMQFTYKVVELLWLNNLKSPRVIHTSTTVTCIIMQDSFQVSVRATHIFLLFKCVSKKIQNFLLN